MGVGLYLCLDLGRIRLRGVRDRCLRPLYRWLAGQPDGPCQVGFAALRVVLDALEQALHDRRPVHRGGLVHHSDRGSQYVSIKYTERLAEAGIEPSVGSVGASVLDDTQGGTTSMPWDEKRQRNIEEALSRW